MSESFNYWAFMVGGSGPDVWDKEIKISACDIEDAVKQAMGEAEECGGWICRVEQQDEWEADSPMLVRVRQLENDCRREHEEVERLKMELQAWKDQAQRLSGAKSKLAGSAVGIEQQERRYGNGP